MINSEGLELIKSFEGCSLVAYQDQAGHWTIGYGHCGEVEKGDVCTQEEALDYLLEDIRRAEEAVCRLVEVPLTGNQKAALVSFCFNLGSGNLGQSTLLHFLNKGNYEHAAEEFLKWVKVAGKPSAGLLRRRQAERELFLR